MRPDSLANGVLPTFTRTAQRYGSWRLPTLTFGWQIAGWCADYLLRLGDFQRPAVRLPERYFE